MVCNFTNSLYKCVTSSLMTWLKESTAKDFEIPKQQNNGYGQVYQLLTLTDGLTQ